MKHLSLFAALVLACSGTWAQSKSCEELKAEIAAKIDANGVTHYTLEVVATEQAGDRKVVGSCEGGSKKIIYVRN